MSEAEKPAGDPVGDIVYTWWEQNIASRDENSRARALAARLRRGDVQTILCEREVHDLARKLNLGFRRADDLVRLVSLLAEIRTHVSFPLAKLLGKEKNAGEKNNPILSNLRFQRLMRSESQELISLLRRGINLVGKQCNVNYLAGDLLHWNEKTRTKWCFQYFDVAAPKNITEEKTQ